LEQATDSVRDTTTRLEAAEQAVVSAQSELDVRRKDAERTRLHAELAAADLEKAQQAFDRARARMAEFK